MKCFMKGVLTQKHVSTPSPTLTCGKKVPTVWHFWFGRVDAYFMLNLCSSLMTDVFFSLDTTRKRDTVGESMRASGYTCGHACGHACVLRCEVLEEKSNQNPTKPRGRREHDKLEWVRQQGTQGPDQLTTSSSHLLQVTRERRRVITCLICQRWVSMATWCLNMVAGLFIMKTAGNFCDTVSI